jgi:DHA1 family multidrug resistance protein-like MFS transporter
MMQTAAEVNASRITHPASHFPHDACAKPFRELFMAVTSVDSSTKNTQATNHFATLNRALLLVSLPFGILNFVLPIYGKQIGASAVEIGLLFSIFSLMTVLLRPLVGAGLDRYGRRWFFIAGLAAYGLAMLAFAFSTAIFSLIIARMLQGVAAAVLWLAVNAIVADLAQAGGRGGAFGNVSQSTNQGGIIGTFIGFTVLFRLGIASGWQPLFIGYAAAGAFAVLLALRRMPETRPAALAKNDPGLSSGLCVIFHSGSLLVLMLVGLLTAASSSMLSPIFMIFLQEKFQADISVLALAFLPSALVWAALPTRLGKLSDRFGRKPLMVLAMFIAAVDSFIVPRMASLAALAILWAVEAVCFAASDPASQALVTDLTGEEQRGRVFGIYAFSSGLGAVIGPLAGGWLYDAIGQTAPFLINAGVLALSGVVLWLVLEKK